MEQLKADFADKLVLLQQQMKTNFDNVILIIIHVIFYMEFIRSF
jgi:hypothetical protein